MIKFANPDFFHLLWLVPLLLVFFVWAKRQKRRMLQRLGDPALIERLSKSISHRRRLWKIALILTAFFVWIIALANPQIGTRVEEIKRQGVDIFIALDVSKSMMAEDVAPNRFERARQEISDFIDALQGDRFGLILFAGLAYVQCPLTLDYSAAKLFLSESEIGMVPQPGTSITEAISTATRSFDSQDQKYKVLIVITDGENHEDDPIKAATSMAESGGVVYTVGIGSPSGAPIPEFDKRGKRVGYKKDRQGEIVTTRLDILTLEQIAETGGGKFYSIGAGASGLDKVYEDIMGLEKKELSAREFTQFEDRFQIFIFIALLLLILESLISERRRIIKKGIWSSHESETDNP